MRISHAAGLAKLKADTGARLAAGAADVLRRVKARTLIAPALVAAARTAFEADLVTQQRAAGAK